MSSSRETEREALVAAVARGDLQAAARIIKSTKALDDASLFRTPPLWTAVQRGDERMVRLLADNSLLRDLNLRFGPLSKSVLHGAVQSNRGDIVRMLVEQYGADPDQGDLSMWTPLHMAASRGHLSAVEALVGRADVNCRTTDDLTPLLEACRNGHVDVVNLLLKHGADSDIISCGNDTPIHIACAKGRVDVVHALVCKHGVDVNMTAPVRVQATPLLRAMRSRQASKIVARLVSRYGACTDAVDGGGVSPLMLAKDCETIDILIAHGADVNRVDKNGHSVLTHMMNNRFCGPQVIERMLQVYDVAAEYDPASVFKGLLFQQPSDDKLAVLHRFAQ